MTTPPYEQLKSYENQWVALRKPDQVVVGHGHDLSEAKQDATHNGYTDVIFLKVYPFDVAYIPHLQ
ncbi:MAG: hypothetical protein H0T92_16440 [Pyrinomonadaceae bacterium]|jgi:hypothetical protein|nr:hypothetical protein [Pyrinomonadaceae bacterium]